MQQPLHACMYLQGACVTLSHMSTQQCQMRLHTMTLLTALVCVCLDTGSIFLSSSNTVVSRQHTRDVTSMAVQQPQLPRVHGAAHRR